jgi:hypothetical protein
MCRRTRAPWRGRAPRGGRSPGSVEATGGLRTLTAARRLRQSVPTFAAIPLFERAVCSGGCFALSRRPRKSLRVEHEGWVVEVRSDANIVVARGGSNEQFEGACDEAIGHAQRALDQLSIHGFGDLVIQKVEDMHAAWWLEGGRAVFRYVSNSPMPTPAVHATFKVRNADGTIPAPTAPPPLPWDESYRYFRLSQATDDLFDAYRNLYLALESLLYSMESPYQANGKRRPEGKWLKCALSAADKRVVLSAHVPPGTADPVSYLFADLYDQHRNTLFHAKRGGVQSPALDAAGRAAIVSSLRTLARLYIALAEQATGSRRHGVSVSREATRAMHRAVLRGALGVTDAVVEHAGDDFKLGVGQITWLDTNLLPDTPEPEMTARGTVAVDPGLGAMAIRNIVLGNENEAGEATLGIYDTLEYPLVLEGFHRLEVDLCIYELSPRAPRRRYG